MFDPRDTGLLLTVVHDPGGDPVAMCQFVPSAAISGYSLDLMRRDPGEHPNGLLDFALCSTIDHLRQRGQHGLSLNFAAMRSTLEGDSGDGLTQRVERWALKRMSGVLQIESLWKFNAKYEPDWLPRYIVFDSPEQFAPAVVTILRAESLSEVPVIGRFLTQSAARRQAPALPGRTRRAERSAQAMVLTPVPSGEPPGAPRRGMSGGAGQPKEDHPDGSRVVGDALDAVAVLGGQQSVEGDHRGRHLFADGDGLHHPQLVLHVAEVQPRADPPVTRRLDRRLGRRLLGCRRHRRQSPWATGSGRIARRQHACATRRPADGAGASGPADRLDRPSAG